VKAEGLIPVDEASRQLALGEPERGHREAELAVDSLRARFGSQAVRPARLVEYEVDEEE
jgi:DNA polymerase-4